MGSFDEATALTVCGQGVLTGVVSEDYWVQAGPNGGYLAAIALRGASSVVEPASRKPRSLHVRYLSPPRAGELRVQARVLRAGRAMTSVAVTMSQQDRTFLEASAAFSEPFSEIAFQDRVPPEARPLAEATPVPKQIPLNHRYELLHAIGAPRRSGEHALSGGYIRLAEERGIDVLALAALWDAWPPAVFSRAMTQRFRGAVPTVEATIYFRAPELVVPPGEHVLLRVESTCARDGIVEEDCELWSQSGVFLAQSRQLALLM